MTAENSVSTPTPVRQSSGGFRWAWLAWLAVAIMIALIAWGLVNNNQIKPQIGEPAPDFEIVLFDGYELDGRQNISLSDLQGRVVIMNFWASWCVTCIYESDDLEAIWQDYRDQGVVVLGVAYLDEDKKSLEFMNQYGMTYPSGPDLRSQITSETYFVNQVPETFVIGPDGRVVDLIIGEASYDRMAFLVESLLASN